MPSASQARACGRDALAAEVAGHVADRRLLVGEGEVHQSSSQAVDAASCAGVVLGPGDHDRVVAA